MPNTFTVAFYDNANATPRFQDFDCLCSALRAVHVFVWGCGNDLAACDLFHKGTLADTMVYTRNMSACSDNVLVGSDALFVRVFTDAEV